MRWLTSVNIQERLLRTDDWYCEHICPSIYVLRSILKYTLRESISYIYIYKSVE